MDESTGVNRVDKENTEHNTLDSDSTVAKKHCSSATASNNTADDAAQFIETELDSVESLAKTPTSSSLNATVQVSSACRNGVKNVHDSSTSTPTNSEKHYTEAETGPCEVQQQKAGNDAVPGNDFVVDGFEKHSIESKHPDLNTTSTQSKPDCSNVDQDQIYAAQLQAELNNESTREMYCLRSRRKKSKETAHWVFTPVYLLFQTSI